MWHTFLGALVVAVGLFMLAKPLVGRAIGNYKPIQWSGGGQAGFAGEIAAALFLLGGGFCILTDNGAGLVIALPAWCVGFWSQSRANKRQRRKVETTRQENARRYPGVFDRPPPDTLEDVEATLFDLYDVETSTYLGQARRRDLQTLIEANRFNAEAGSNDVFMIHESLGLLPEDSIRPELWHLLESVLEKNGTITLRWLPAEQKSSGVPASQDGQA